MRKIRTNSDGFTQFCMGSDRFLWAQKLAQKIMTGSLILYVCDNLAGWKILCFFSMYKMFEISKKAYKKCETEIIDIWKYFLINRRDLEVQSNYDNWGQSFDKYDPKKQKYRYKLMPNTKFQSSRRFVRNDLLEKN